MTVYTYAIYRYAARLMRPHEFARATELARQAAGDEAAAAEFRALALDVIADGKRRTGEDIHPALPAPKKRGGPRPPRGPDRQKRKSRPPVPEATEYRPPRSHPWRGDLSQLPERL